MDCICVSISWKWHIYYAFIHAFYLRTIGVTACTMEYTPCMSPDGLTAIINNDNDSRQFKPAFLHCTVSQHWNPFSSSLEIIWYHTFPGDTDGSQTTPGWLTVWLIHYEASVMSFVWFNFVKKKSTWHNILLALASICCSLTWCTTTATTPAAPPHDAQHGACLIDHLGGEEEVNQNHFSFSFPGRLLFPTAVVTQYYLH